MKIPKLILIQAASLTHFSYLHAANDIEEKLPPAVAEAVSTFSKSAAEEAMPAILTLDESGDGTVPLTHLTKHLMSRGFAQVSSGFENKDKAGKRKEESIVKTDRFFLKTLKTDDKGNLNQEGFAKGIETALRFSLKRMLPLDANQDGKLTFAEYAVGRPITEGEEKDAEGYTKKQRERFASIDRDHNQLIEGAEYIINLDFISHSIKASMAALYIDRADKNNDGTLSPDELQKLLPLAENLPNSIQLKESIFWLRQLKPTEIETIQQYLLPNKK